MTGPTTRSPERAARGALHPPGVTARRRGVAPAGFTLIELLVVISIIALVVGLSFPFMRATLRGSSLNMAVGQVNNGIAAARAYATRYKPFLTARPVGATLRTADDNGDGYSGAIALFAQDGSIRILENDENAVDQSGRWMEFLVPAKNGYKPIEDLDDLTIPGRAAVLGIVRTGAGPNDIQLIPPPFAIRFSRDGVLVQGEKPTTTFTGWARYVYVSGDAGTRTRGSGKAAVTANVYETNESRAGQGDFDSDSSNGDTLDTGKYGRRGTETMPDGRTQIPFDAIETVSGVLVLDPEVVPAEWDGTATGFDRDRVEIHTTNQSVAILQWAATTPSARTLFFNRYTGQDLTR